MKVMKWGGKEFVIGRCEFCGREDTIRNRAFGKWKLAGCCLTCIHAFLVDLTKVETELVAAKAGGTAEERPEPKKEPPLVGGTIAHRYYGSSPLSGASSPSGATSPQPPTAPYRSSGSAADPTPQVDPTALRWKVYF